jgi:(S)-sulfolactate dehydrogenase
LAGWASGLDNIDVKACEARGVEVCSARGANATSVSEYAIAMAMILLRGAPISIRIAWWPASGRARSWARAWSWPARRSGVIGLGSIGSTSARKARALDMRVIASDPYLPDDSENWNLAEKVSLDELLARADVSPCTARSIQRRAA